MQIQKSPTLDRNGRVFYEVTAGPGEVHKRYQESRLLGKIIVQKNGTTVIKPNRAPSNAPRDFGRYRDSMLLSAEVDVHSMDPIVQAAKRAREQAKGGIIVRFSDNKVLRFWEVRGATGEIEKKLKQLGPGSRAEMSRDSSGHPLLHTYDVDEGNTIRFGGMTSKPDQKATFPDYAKRLQKVEALLKAETVSIPEQKTWHRGVKFFRERKSILLLRNYLRDELPSHKTLIQKLTTLTKV